MADAPRCRCHHKAEEHDELRYSDAIRAEVAPCVNGMCKCLRYRPRVTWTDAESTPPSVDEVRGGQPLVEFTDGGSFWRDDSDDTPVMSLACAAMEHDECDEQPEPGISFTCGCFCHRLKEDCP